jgi:CheY-like chemotaxis protein
MRRVLIIDNDPTLAELLCLLLTEEGYHTTAVCDTTPATVRDAVKHSQPDVVLLDDHSPLDFDASWDTAAWLRRRPRPVPSIMLTAHQHSAAEALRCDTPQSQAAAMVAVLTKPFDLDDVMVAVDRAMHPPRLIAAAALRLTR